MSWLTGAVPGAPDGIVDLVIEPVTKDLGGFRVRRALPSPRRQLIGPFIFLDHLGPARFEPGHGIDVRPHPHIGLATLSYLVEGRIRHRDSIGSDQEIVPGDVNWMTAGRGIAHSERSDPDRTAARVMAGLQSWVALPRAHEESAPGFFHHAGASLPALRDGGVTVRLIAGAAYGVASPVATLSAMVYADVTMDAGSSLPLPGEHAERGVYLLHGAVLIGGERYGAHCLLVFRPGDAVTLRAEAATRLIVLGGEPMDGPRHLWWNFVHSSKDRIEAAKADWRAGRFDRVPGDQEFIPLPE
jgi:redox-sensitive bicupin YhaK (pirin superfamily)